MQNQIQKQQAKPKKQKSVLRETVHHVRSDTCIGVMKHKDGTIEKRKF